MAANDPSKKLQTSPPNIVWILTDDQGYGELGCNGNPDIETPHIDALFQESIRFTDFHVGTTCAPTRSGLLTGHYCNSAGVWHTIGGRSLLRENEWTLPQALSTANYKTAHFGKWHLGDTHPFRPFERGFDLSIYHGGGGVGNTPDHWGNDYFDDTYFVNGTPKKFTGYCTDVFFDEALGFIRENSEKPFFCYIATNAPHGPFNVENRYADIYRQKGAEHDDRACFYGMVTNIDENVGKLRAALEEMNLSDNTIVVFMSDNGSGGGVTCDKEGHVTEGPCNFNAGMRGTKGWEYEGGHRVPFIFHVPDGMLGATTTSTGRDVSDLTSYIDFMPTILDLCSVPVPSDRTFHGISLGPTIRGWEQPELLHRSVVVDTQRLARPVKWHRSCVMTRKWRLVDRSELYDLETDPSQCLDVSKDHPELVESMCRDYEDWWELVSKQFALDTPFVLDGTADLHLSTHDIRNDAGDTAWHQSQVRQAYAVSGYWALDIRKASTYRIELRRWPKSTGYRLTQGIDGDDSGWRKDCIQKKYARLYEGGVALNLKWAHVEVCGKSLHAQMDDDTADSVAFETDLPLGETQLFAGFYEKRPFGDNRTIAPYYIYISENEI